MIYVGISEMKNHFSDYVRQVREGETVLVTDRGKIIAKLIRPGHSDERMDEDTKRLEADGLLSRCGGENRPELYEGLAPLMQKGTVLELLDAERGNH